jgi:hypothetical protein
VATNRPLILVSPTLNRPFAEHLDTENISAGVMQYSPDLSLDFEEDQLRNKKHVHIFTAENEEPDSDDLPFAKQRSKKIFNNILEEQKEQILIPKQLPKRT